MTILTCNLPAKLAKMDLSPILKEYALKNVNPQMDVSHALLMPTLYMLVLNVYKINTC